MNGYARFLDNTLYSKTKRLMVIIATLLALMGSILMFPTKLVKAKMLPSKSANTFSVYVDLPAGSSIEETKKVSRCVVNILRQEKEILNMETFLGEGAPLDYAGLTKGSTLKGMENVSEIVINLTDKHSREEPSFIIIQRLRPIIQSTCEPLKNGTNIKMIEQPSGPPNLASIVVEVFGPTMKKISPVAKKVAEILENTPKVVDVDVMMDEKFSKFSLEVNSDKISKSGVSVEQLNNILYLAFEGMVVAIKNPQNANDQIPIFLMLDKNTKELNSFSKGELESKLSSLKLMNKMGMMVPVNEMVELKEVPNNLSIFTKDLETMVNVIAETDMESQVYPLLDARETMIEEFSDKFEVTKEAGINTYMFDLHLVDKESGEKYLLRWDGEMKVTLDTFRDLGAAFIGALVLIFLLLVIYYKSFAISGIILAGSFLSIIGVIVGHWVADIVTTHTFFLTATSLIGFIALMGISSRNSLLLIDFAKSLMIEKGLEKRKAISVATATRAKPIMLTAVAIILGSALLAGDPIFGGLGVALISGTIAAVIVSLLFVPVLMNNSKAMDFDKAQ